ncbi:MAG: hypothetical protein GXO64_02220 [Candidatus Micrarchaeota archaeon]|nr:hypothetical protein [Candidatus Micrarchaeota archaeon]
MGDYLSGRPKKRVLPMDEQERIIKEAVELVRRELSGNPRVKLVMLTGSALSYSIGKYEKPLSEKYARQYSDIDFTAITGGKLSPKPGWALIAERDFWEVYRLGKIEGKYPVECLFIEDATLKDDEKRKIAEGKGIPSGRDSPVPHRVVYER